MTVIDADAHVLESLETFADQYLDSAYRPRRPQSVRSGGHDHWLIDGHLFPRYAGRGCHIIGTPTGSGGVRTHAGRRDGGALESNQLRDVEARVREMREEEIDVQVIYPTLFLIPVTGDADFGTALCRAYNNWIAERCRPASDRLKWVAVVDLRDVGSAVAELRRVRTELNPVAVMILGTVDEKPLSHASLAPFFADVEAAGLPLAVHVGWSYPPLANMYATLPESLLVPFTMPLLMAFVAFTAGGLLDRFPKLRVAFLELGCEWVPFLAGRIDHQFRFFRQHMPELAARRDITEYLRSGQVYVGCEVEDPLLPHVIGLMGADHILYGSDIPHADRERFTVRTLRQRSDVPDSAKRKILDDNARRFYNL